jgi:hypothetical protein
MGAMRVRDGLIAKMPAEEAHAQLYHSPFVCCALYRAWYDTLGHGFAATGWYFWLASLGIVYTNDFFSTLVAARRNQLPGCTYVSKGEKCALLGERREYHRNFFIFFGRGVLTRLQGWVGASMDLFHTPLHGGYARARRVAAPSGRSVARSASIRMDSAAAAAIADALPIELCPHAPRGWLRRDKDTLPMAGATIIV